MALRGEIGWQSDKTLSECTLYMFDNEIATDVIFEVGPPDGATVKILAHKFMLISRSPVFEAMFNSGMTECRSGAHTTIRVEDIDVTIFKDLLRYIYCDVISVNAEISVSLMYAANKYLLPKLVKECGKCLSECLNVDNVIQVLEQSLLFNDSELKSKCVQLIAQNAKAILTGTRITSASREAIDTILQMEKLPVQEIVIYEACIAWAKHQFLQGSTENHPTDQRIREILGDLLYKIRFPTMEGTEFADICESSSILTEGEKTSVYYFLMKKKKGSNLVFPTEKRRQRSEEVWIERTVACASQQQWRSTPRVDAINFTTNQDILLTGIGLYTGYNGASYGVDVEILQSTDSLFKKKLRIPSTGDANQFKVSIDEPISIKAGVIFSVKALSDNNIGHYGQTCQAICTNGTVTFTFTPHQNVDSPTTPTRGQIPRLYFYMYF